MAAWKDTKADEESTRFKLAGIKPSPHNKFCPENGRFPVPKGFPVSVAANRFDNEKRRRPDSHVRQAMLTPDYVLEPVRELLGGIDLDPCTDPDNPTKARYFYHLPQDGCELPWGRARTVFCNPPYGEARNRWVEKCIVEGRRIPVVLLIPSHTETRIFQKALENCTSVLFCKSRLKFGVLRENRRQEAASHGSALLGFGIDLWPLHHLGQNIRVEPLPRLKISDPVSGVGLSQEPSI